MMDSSVLGIRNRTDEPLFCELLNCLCDSRFVVVPTFCQLLEADPFLFTDAEQEKLLPVSDAEAGQSCLKVSLSAALDCGNMF